ncbi:MAG: hypothetical protein ACOZNI_29745 [Myxococcota bacterium]
MRGTIAADEPVVFEDPLSRLPLPADDRGRVRTFPGRPDAGEMRWEPLAGLPGTTRFTTRLPARYGDVGWIAARGLYADAGWYPQPVGPDGLPLVARWEVRVVLPEGATGVLNGRVGEGVVAWQGESDRAALAVLRDAVVTTVPAAGGELRLVEHRRHERHTARVLSHLLEAGWPLLEPPRVTIVETLDHHRLVRPAPGMLYLSERALRLMPGFEGYHFGALRRGLFAAAAPLAEGRSRDFVAAALAADLPAPSAEKLLRWFAWNPLIDALLHDGTLPYYSDIFGEPFAEATGLWDALDPRIPGPALAAQLDDLRGEGTAASLARLLLAGADLGDAAAAMAVPPALVEGWGKPYPGGQDYRAKRGAVTREAVADAPAEVVIVEADGERLSPWVAGPGPASLAVEGRTLNVDPDGHVRQIEGANDSWPSRWGVVVNAGLYAVSPSQGSFTFQGDLVFRRRADTRNVYFLSATHDAQDLVGAGFGYVRYLGPLIDRRNRPHRLYAWGGPALLDPAFRPTDAGAVAVGGGVQYTWDTRTDLDFATEGHRLQVGVGGGFVPGSDEAWASASATATRLFPLHPRHVIAARAKGSWASGDVEHRLLPLGGAGNVRAVAVAEIVGNERAVASVEYRWVPLRNVSVPMGGNWLSEVHLTPGLDTGVLRRGDTVAAAVGATLGVHVAVDVLGARPTLGGATFALPVWTRDVGSAGMQWYLEFNHAF